MFNKFADKIIVGAGIIQKMKNWPEYIKDYLKQESGEVAYHMRNGSAYVLRAGSSDRNVFTDIVIREIYTPPGFEIKKGDVVLDIGAHAGLFSLFASQNAGKVYSFEPEPRNFAILTKNAADKANIVTFQKGMSGTSGSGDLFLHHSKDFHSFHQNFLGKRTEKITVETLSLQDFFSKNNIQRIDFAKIDCEGHEYDILFNCPSELLKKIKKISMECHVINSDNPHYSVNGMKEFLEKNNFNVTVAPMYGSFDPIAMIYAALKA